MSAEQVEVPAPSSPPVAAGGAALPARVLAGLAGVVWLAAISVGLLGIPLLVALAILGSAIVLRRRGRMLRRGQAWLVAFFSSGALIALAFGALILSLPPAERARLTSASSSAEEQPDLPDWLERLNQRSAQGGGAGGDAAADRLAESKPFQLYITIFTAVVLVAFLAALVGSLVWVGAGLLRYGRHGAWFPPGERTPLPGDPQHSPFVEASS